MSLYNGHNYYALTLGSVKDRLNRVQSTLELRICSVHPTNCKSTMVNTTKCHCSESQANSSKLENETADELVKQGTSSQSIVSNTILVSAC